MKPASTARAILLAICLQFFAQHSFSQNIFNYGSNWNYLNNGSDQGTAWYGTSYTETGWTSNAPSTFYYGESLSGTLLSSNPITTYFRRTFNVTGLSAYNSFDINVIADDGAVIYINGQEVARDNMPTGTVTYTTLGTNKNGGSEGTPTPYNVSKCYFNEGINVIAVEVHQSSAGNTDMRFDAKIDGVAAPASVTLSRGPYLNMANQTAITVRWRTNLACVGQVEVGTVHGTYPLLFAESCPTTEHEVRVTGLTADTKYYYRFGTATQTLQNATSNFFRTAPVSNSTRKLRFTVFGDCGINSLSYQTNSLAQYQAYLTANSIDAPDAWLLLGDNAYSSGTDGEYTSGFFNPYQSTITKNHILFPAPGNHDYANSTTRQDDHLVPYYDIFTLPTAAQSGGTASGTEAYYSWDWGNVHFLSLDSYGEENGGTTRLYDTTGAQMLWVKSDLAANTKKWVVAYWHHPPYTMGSHNSDTETDLVAIRAKAIKVLERLGVDMILCGHSHDYERSKLLNGHYGNEVTTAGMSPYLKSSTSGAYDGTVNSCVYTTASNTQNHGTVYVLAGSSGNSGGTNAGLDGYPHNAMPYSVNDGGIFYFEVEDNRLDAKFIREDGSIFDKFTIMKDVSKSNNQSIALGNSVQLTASWIGTYSWSTGATTRSVNVTPPDGTTVYTVTDLNGCLTDQFSVTATGTLPVNLKNYFVNLRTDKVYVDWSTAGEYNNKEFTIERSVNAQQFNTIGIVQSIGNSTSEIAYQFIDPSPLEGVSYYRLSQTNIDGSAKIFPVKKIVNNKDKGFYADAYVSSPQTISMQVYSSKPERIQMRVFDMNGRVVKSESWMLGTGSNNHNLEIKNGVYILEWKRTDGQSVSQKIIVQ
jgi:acid phosphatase type 7